MKMVKKFQLKFVILKAVRNRCMLHGRVFVMKEQISIFSAGVSRILKQSTIDIINAT